MKTNNQLEENCCYSEKNIVFSPMTNSGTIAGFNSSITTADLNTMVFKPIVYREITVELFEKIKSVFSIQESTFNYLKLSEESFNFWDNDMDSKYDSL